MESSKRQVGSSFSADIFDSTKESTQPSNSAGIFSSLFPPPSKVMGRKASASELLQSLEKQSGCREWNKQPRADVTKDREGAGHCTSSKERESLFQNRVEPCPLSSSLFYGGQEDMYVKSSDAQKMVAHTCYKKEGGEYDSGGNNQYSASRGNWWEGSLYY